MSNLLAQAPAPTGGVDIGKQFWLKWNLGISDVKEYKTLGGIVSILLKNAYILAGVILLILLIVGGLGVIMGAGGGDPKKAAQGQQSITTALIGFLLIFASYWIIQIISILTGFNILSPGI